MKKFWLAFFCLFITMPYCLASSLSDNSSRAFYYASILYCPKERPIRKVQLNLDEDCDMVFFNLEKVDEDYLRWLGGEKICKIPPFQQKKQQEINTKIKELEKAVKKENNTIKRVREVLGFPVYVGCLYGRMYDKINFEPHKGDCTEEELNYLRKRNDDIEKSNTKHLSQFYGKNCFSCDADMVFITDKETCDLCSNREMNGNECVLRKDKK